jgi:hypothetical protein
MVRSVADGYCAAKHGKNTNLLKVHNYAKANSIAEIMKNESKSLFK